MAKHQVKLTEAEWELLGQRLQDSSWKDEFVTIVIFSPFIIALLGAFLAVFGRPELSRAAAEMMAQITALNIDYGNLLYITTLAALGLRALKK